MGEWELQQWGGGTRDKVETLEHERLVKRVKALTEATSQGVRLQVCSSCNWVGYPKEPQCCNHCRCKGRLSHASPHEFIMTGIDEGPVVVPEYHGIPEELHGIESLRWIGEVPMEERGQLRKHACAEMKNLDRLMAI